MKTNTLFLLGVSLLFSTLISRSLGGGMNCAILAGKNGSDIAGGPLPSSNGFRHGVSLNLAAGAQIVPHMITMVSSFDYFVFSSPSENVIKKLTFDGQVSILSGKGTAGYNDGAPSDTQYNDPKGISYDHNAGSLYVADYSNQKIRSIYISNGVGSSTLYDFASVLSPIAIFLSNDNFAELYVLGDNFGTAGQSIGILNLGDFPVDFSVNLISAFSSGQCNSMTQDGFSPYRVYFGCGSTIKMYDESLNFISDFSTSFTAISGLYMDPTKYYPAPLYVTDSGANKLYNFDITLDTKDGIAGSGGVYDGNNDNYGVTDCTSVSFNSILSASASNFGTLVMLTETNIYVEVPSSPTTSFPNVVEAPLDTSNPTPNVLTLNFNSYNATTGTLHTTLNFQPQYTLFAYTQYGKTDFILVDSFVINWWQNGSSNVQNITLPGDQILTLDYDFTDFESGLYYYIKLQYSIPTLSVDTTYIFGPETKLISGPPSLNVWNSEGQGINVADPGVGSSASYEGSISGIAFDPVTSLFYYADFDNAFIASISRSDGTELLVAGDLNENIQDGQGLRAEFLYPVNAVFDPVNRLLYVGDGGYLGSGSTNLRTIDVDHSYNVQTINTITGFSSALINAFTIDGSGNIYIYDSNNHWNYVTKSGSTYTVSSSHVDETEGSSDGVNLVFWTQGDICQNSGVSSCLVVQNGQIQYASGAVYGPIYTVRTDTWAANIINLGNYRFTSIAVDQNGNMYVYSPLMGLGQYLPNQGLIAWFGGYSLSVSSYMATNFINTDPNYTGSNSITESYSNTLAAFTQYDSGHGDSISFFTMQPITFDNNGSVYLFDNYNFRQYSFPQSVVVGTTTTSTTTTITTTGGVSTTSTTGSSITSGSSTTGGGHNNINKVPLDCYSLSVTVDKGLRKVNPTQTFTLQDLGCNTTFWEIVGVNTTALYSYANNKLVLNIPTNTSGIRPAHYQIAYTETEKSIHQVITNITIVNHNPVINNATFTWTYPRTTQTFPTWNLLTGCADQDGDSLSVVQIMKTNARVASTIVQYDPYTMLFVTEKALLQVTPNGQITLSSPSTTTPGTAGAPLALFWKQNLSFQFEITDGDVLKSNTWGTANINYN